MVKIFETSNPALIAFVESLLKSGDVQYLAKNLRTHNAFNIPDLTGPVEFWVHESDAADCARLLQGVMTGEELRD